MPKINLLPPEVARKIAAGEVIDRPASVLRELLDNAIDSGAGTIEVRLTDGGIGEITVTDNGCGMDEEDLRRSILPHATSKIATASDMQAITSLGFRGEALASVAACSRLVILTRPADSDGAFRLTSDDIGEPRIEPAAGAPGTTVTVRELFYNIPARKKFLSSPAGESNACTNIFIEKATAHPQISFRLFINEKPKLFFPKCDIKERVSAVLKGLLQPEALRLKEQNFDRFRISVVGCDPGFYRKDKKYIRIFLNKRAIVEYAFVQAVEFAYREYMQSVCYPYCFVFIEIDPALVDFNIHPAKREVRIRNRDDVHHAIVTTVRTLAAGTGSVRPEIPKPAPAVIPALFDDGQLPKSAPNPAGIPVNGSAFPAWKKENAVTKAIRDTAPVFPPKTVRPPSNPLSRNRKDAAAPFRTEPRFEYPQSHTPNTGLSFEPVTAGTASVGESAAGYRSAFTAGDSGSSDFIYRGQIFNLFLLAEKNDEFYIIDQHAAHERILFERFRKAPPQRQPLLAPLKLKIEESEKIESVIESLKTTGIEIERREDGLYLTAVGRFWEGNEALIEEELSRPFTSLFELEKRLMATHACKSAIKDGDPVSPETAKEIIAGAFRLENPHCPHGRPIWFRLTRTDLFKLVGRLV